MAKVPKCSHEYGCETPSHAEGGDDPGHELCLEHEKMRRSDLVKLLLRTVQLGDYPMCEQAECRATTSFDVSGTVYPCEEHARIPLRLQLSASSVDQLLKTVREGMDADQKDPDLTDSMRVACMVAAFEMFADRVTSHLNLHREEEAKRERYAGGPILVQQR